MRSIFLAGLLSMAFCVVSAQSSPEKPFTVSGTTSKVKEVIQEVILMYAMNGERVMDTAKVKNGLYQVSGKLAEPVIARVRATYPADASGKKAPVNAKKDMAVVFLQPGKITISHSDSLANASIQGSAAHEAYLKLDAQLKRHNSKMQDLSTSY